MKLVGPGLIKLTWLEWEQHSAGVPGMGLRWWQHPLKHAQHWLLATFGGHTTDVSLEQFISQDQVVPGGPPFDPKALSPEEIEAILNEPPKLPRPGPNPWQLPAGRREDYEP